MDSSESSPDSARLGPKRLVDLNAQRREHDKKIREKNERDEAAHQEAERLDAECQHNDELEVQPKVKTKMDKLKELRESISQTRWGIKKVAGDVDLVKRNLSHMKEGVEKQAKLLDEIMNEMSSPEGSTRGVDSYEGMKQ